MKYNLLICSDTHEAAPGIIPPPDTRCWLHAGDFYNNKDIASSDDESDAQYADTIGALEGGEAYQWFKSFKMPIYSVRGNHDGHDAWGFFRTVQDITGKVARVTPELLVAGIGWHGRNYNDLPSEANFTDVCSTLSGTVRRLRKPGDMLILLTHYPAYAPPVAKNQEGTFTTLRELAGSIKPVLIIQGHIHQWAGSQYDVLLDSKRVLVANPGGFGMAVSVDPAKGSVSIAGQPGGRAGH